MSSKKILIVLLISVAQSAQAANNDEVLSNAASAAEQVIEIQTQDIVQTNEVNEILREVHYESSHQRLNKVSEKSL